MGQVDEFQLVARRRICEMTSWRRPQLY